VAEAASCGERFECYLCREGRDEGAEMNMLALSERETEKWYVCVLRLLSPLLSRFGSRR
jgi:hypothetical protein